MLIKVNWIRAFGLMNIVLGTTFSIFFFIFIAVIIPQIITNFSESGVDTSSLAKTNYNVLGRAIILGFVNLFFGWKLTKGDEKTKKKFLPYGAAFLFMSAMFYAFLIVITIYPFYKLTVQPYNP